MDLLSNIAIGILTNTIYDIVKFAGHKYFIRQSGKDKELRELVEVEITKNLPEDLTCLFESSVFVLYFNSPQFLDVINAYLEHKIICDYVGKSTKIQKMIKKNGIITATDVINYISESINNLYEKSQVTIVPSKSCIQNAVEFILSIIDTIIIHKLDPETTHLLYYFNSRADVAHKQIMSMLTSLQVTITQVQKKQVSLRNLDYEETKAKYYSILKERNSDAHIYLLDKFPFEQFYVPPILQSSVTEHIDVNMYDGRTFTSWKNIWKNSNIIYLTGGAGYGKSLFTKKIINSYVDLNIFRGDEYLVIYGELKSFYPNGTDTAISVVEFLMNSIKSSTLMEVSSDFIEHYLDSGRCIVLLDALDEVEKSKRIFLHESLIAFFKSQNPNNKICITSRDRGFIPERNVEVFKICPLNEEQIEKYVDKIIALKKFEKADKKAFMKQTEALVNKGFLNSFLVLSLLINIYKAERELPENKLELYQKCFEYIANKREKEKTQKDFDWRVISPIMKDNTFIELARMGLPNNSNIDRNDIRGRLLHIYRTKYASEVDVENAIEEFLKFCADRTELFVPTAEDKYKFFHRSFFEYFYALYIFLRCSSEEDMLKELLKFDVDSEVFELTIAMLKQQSEDKYQVLLELMFDKAEAELASSSEDFSVLNILILSMQVVDDVLYRKRFLDIIVEQKDIILKNIDSLHNLKLMAGLYENDEAACEKIANSYSEEYLFFLFEGCKGIFKIAGQFKKDTNRDFVKDFLNDPNDSSIKRHIIYRHVDTERVFYVPIVFKMRESKKILLEADKELITEIYKKFSPQNYKKAVSDVVALLKQYQSFSEDEQVEFIKLICQTRTR